MKERLKNNFGLKLLSLLLAFLLWLLVINIDKPMETKVFQDIPVVVEHGEIVTQQKKTYRIVDNTQTVNVKVYATRSVLSKISNEDIVATADMKELFLESQVPIEIEIKGANYESAQADPRNLQVKIEDNSSKSIPITPVSVGTVRDGYVLGEMNVEPKKVTINGPESVVDRVNKAVAEVSVSGLSEDTEKDAKLILYDINGEVIDQTQLANNLGNFGVSVNVKILKAKSVPIVADGSNLQVKEGYSVSELAVTPKAIEVAGETENLKNIDKIYIPPDALESKVISEKTDISVDILPYLPEGIRLADESESTVVVTVTVEKDGTKNLNLPVGSITVMNLDEGYNMNYSTTNDLEVHVEGPREILKDLTVDKLASIDLSEYHESGSYTVPVSIELPDGCSLYEKVEIEIILEKKKRSSE